MSCSVGYDIREEYPETLEAVFISRTGDTIVNTLEGMIEEIQKQGATSAIPLVRSFESVTDLTDLFKAQRVFLEKIVFYAYDVKELNAPDQDNDSYNTLIGSRIADLILPQSNYMRSLVPVNFQPNHFRPKVFVDSKAIFHHEVKSDKAVALNSIGYVMPKCFELNRRFTDIKKFDIMSAYAQRLDEAVYMNYFMTAEVTFWIGTGNKK